jgi:hypothetical protein
MKLPTNTLAKLDPSSPEIFSRPFAEIYLLKDRVN